MLSIPYPPQEWVGTFWMPRGGPVEWCRNGTGTAPDRQRRQEEEQDERSFGEVAGDAAQATRYGSPATWTLTC